MYYNTTHETQEQCKMFERSNMAQTDRILKIVKDKKIEKFSASKIYKIYPVASTPITSIRRSLHTLNYKLNAIVATGKKVSSMYGRPELEYKLNPQLELL